MLVLIYLVIWDRVQSQLTKGIINAQIELPLADEIAVFDIQL